MPNWFLLALGTVVLWGVWGMLLKMAVDRLGPNTTYFLHSLTFTAIVVLYKLVTGFKIATHATGISIVIASAVFAASGGLLLLLALGRGKASTVFPLIALYPAVTVLLSLFLLKESLTGTQWTGVGLALLAGFLLSR